MSEAYDFEHYPMAGLNFPNPGSAPDLDVAQTVCGPSLASGSDNHHYEMLRSHSMPNSLVTFNRFWNTKGSTSPTVARNAMRLPDRRLRSRPSKPLI